MYAKISINMQLHKPTKNIKNNPNNKSPKLTTEKIKTKIIQNSKQNLCLIILVVAVAK